MQPSYASPIAVTDLDQCWFYHSMDLPDGAVGGVWDMRGRFADYTGQVPLRARTVLDVGAASGFLTFEAERAGAIVTSFDAESVVQYQVVPGTRLGHISFTELRRSYWLAHRAYRSKVRAIYGDIYRLSEIVPPQQVVLIGQILVHLRDPLAALQQAALVATEQIIITEGCFAAPQPLAVFLGGKHSPYGWWHLSDELYRQWLALVGFEVTAVTRARYRCNQVADDVELWTFVADRR